MRTVRINIVGTVNLPEIKTGIEILQSFDRGSWLLVNTLEKLTVRVDEPTRAESSGKIIFKDNKFVVLYTNDHEDKPRKDVVGSRDYTLN